MASPFLAAGAGLSRGLAQGMQIGMQLREQERVAEIQKAQMGLKLIEGFNQLLDVPPNIAAPMFDAFSRSIGMDPENANVKTLAKVFGKLDPEQRQVFKDYLGTVGAKDPDKVIDFVSQITRSPKTMLQLFGQVAKFQQEQTLGEMMGGGAQSPQGGMPSGPSSPIQEQTITGQPSQLGQVQPQPQVNTAIQENIAQTEQALDALQKRSQVILQSALPPEIKKKGIDQLNVLIDNYSKRLQMLYQRLSGGGGVADEIVRQMASRPDGTLDADKAREVYRSLRTNPQGAEGRIFTYLEQKNRTGQKDPAMERTIREYQNMLSATSASRAAGGVEGAMGVRRTPEFQQTERGVTEARGLGARAAEAREQLGNLAQSSAIIDELDALTKTFITATNGVQANIQGATLKTQSLANPGSTPGVYEGRKKNLAEALARNIGGVKGTATEGDISRMLSGLPNFRDTIASRNYKINAVREIIATAVDNQKRLISGEPVDLEKARKQFREMVNNFLKESKAIAGQTEEQGWSIRAR